MTDKQKADQHSRSQLRRLAQQKGEPMPEFNAAPQADALLRECRETMLTLARGTPVRDLDEQISRIDAHLNAAPQDASIRKGEDGIVDTDSRKVESVTSPVATPAGAAPATERGELIKQLQERARIRRQIPTRKSVQEGQPDRIADLLERAAAALSRDSEDAERNIDAIVNRIVDAYQDSPKTNYMLAHACTQAIRSALAARGREP